MHEEPNCHPRSFMICFIAIRMLESHIGWVHERKVSLYGLEHPVKCPTPRHARSVLESYIDWARSLYMIVGIPQSPFVTWRNRFIVIFVCWINTLGTETSCGFLAWYWCLSIKWVHYPWLLLYFLSKVPNMQISEELAHFIYNSNFHDDSIAEGRITFFFFFFSNVIFQGFG